MQNIINKAWQRGRSLLPTESFVFGRPLVVLQSDDWGRVGVRDKQAWDELRASGVNLGERNYDYYSLETAEDLAAISSLLRRHRDSTGRAACLGMNFILANVDFARVVADGFRQIHLRPLTLGLPDGWNRTGLFKAYREGIASGVFSPALHGATHFCRSAAERYLNDPGERGTLLRILWKAGVPYIHWRMPWMGFEYSDPGDDGQEAFLSSEVQEGLIIEALRTFTQFFSMAPRSACAPGFRANKDTHCAWEKLGIHVAQNGPGKARPPHLVAHTGSPEKAVLHLYRTADFEPSAAQEFSVHACIRMAENSFARGIPAIISVHSINFHSSLKDFRSRTLTFLDHFLSTLEARHPDLLYVRDQDLYDLVDKGMYESMQATVRMQVSKRMFYRGVGSA